MNPFSDWSPSKLTDELSTVGPAPHPEFIEACLASFNAIRPTLLQFLKREFDPDAAPITWNVDDPRWDRTQHAGRILLHQKDESAFDIILTSLQFDVEPDLIDSFDAGIRAFGVEKLPVFKDLVRDEGIDVLHRMRAVGYLASVAHTYPEVRDDGVEELCAHLPEAAFSNPDALPDVHEVDSDAPMLWSEIAYELARLGVTEVEDAVNAMFDRDLIDLLFLDRSLFQQMLYDEAQTPEPADFDAVETAREIWRSADFDERQSARTAASKGKKNSPSRRVGRNDPCPCGSGRKYKHCCG